MSVASVIDLRSDTLTQPSAGMRAAMTSASVGDDVYDEDPTVHELEARVAALLGHEAGLFTATGSLANQLGVALHVGPGEEVLCDARAHIARAEMGAHGALHGVTMRTWVTNDGVADAAQITNLLEPDAGPYLVSTRCVALENTHNFGGGTIQPLPGLQRVTRICHDLGVKVHLDGPGCGTRTSRPASRSTPTDASSTVSVCLSGLGAPVGSVLVGTASQIARARVCAEGWARLAPSGAAGRRRPVRPGAQHRTPADDHAAAQAFAEAVEARRRTR